MQLNNPLVDPYAERLSAIRHNYRFWQNDVPAIISIFDAWQPPEPATLGLRWSLYVIDFTVPKRFQVNIFTNLDKHQSFSDVLPYLESLGDLFQSTNWKSEDISSVPGREYTLTAGMHANYTLAISFRVFLPTGGTSTCRVQETVIAHPSREETVFSLICDEKPKLQSV